MAVSVGDHLQPAARAGRAGARSMRRLHAVSRRVSDRRARRAARAGLDALPVVSDHRVRGAIPEPSRERSARTSTAATSARKCVRGTLQPRTRSADRRLAAARGVRRTFAGRPVADAGCRAAARPEGERDARARAEAAAAQHRRLRGCDRRRGRASRTCRMRRAVVRRAARGRACERGRSRNMHAVPEPLSDTTAAPSPTTGTRMMCLSAKQADASGPVADLIPARPTLKTVRDAAEGCRACDLYKRGHADRVRRGPARRGDDGRRAAGRRGGSRRPSVRRSRRQAARSRARPRRASTAPVSTSPTS